MKFSALLMLSLLILGAGSIGSAEPVAPAAPKEDQAKTTNPAEVVVYITATGKRYHRATCRYAKIKSNLKEAAARGLTPCLVCNP